MPIHLPVTVIMELEDGTNTAVSVECRYLGLFAKEVDAAQAYDRESVSRKGLKAITNFDICEYLDLLSVALLPVSPLQIYCSFAYLLS